MAVQESKEDKKADAAVASRRSEVIIAVTILLFMVVLAVVAYRIFAKKDCDSEAATTAGGTKAKTSNLAFKDRYRGKAFKPENIHGDMEDPEKYDSLRLHEFKLGDGTFMEAVDFKRVMDAPTASVFGWFRIPPSDGIVHLAQRYGHTEPRSPGLTAELKPGRKLFSFMALKNNLTLHIYGDDGSTTQSVSVEDKTIRDGQWHNIGFSVAPSGVCIYVDGMKVMHQRTGVNIPTNVYPSALAIGNPSDDMFFASNVIYSVEPTDAIKASALYNNGQPTDPKILISGLRAWYPMQSNRAVDLMGNMMGQMGSGAPRRKASPEKAEGDQFKEIQSMGRFVKKVPLTTSFVA